MDEGAPESGGVIVKIMAVGLNKEKGRQAFGLLPFGAFGGLGWFSRRNRFRAAAAYHSHLGSGSNLTV
jgi:hypothetical protein